MSLSAPSSLLFSPWVLSACLHRILFKNIDREIFAKNWSLNFCVRIFVFELLLRIHMHVNIFHVFGFHWLIVVQCKNDFNSDISCFTQVTLAPFPSLLPMGSFCMFALFVL